MRIEIVLADLFCTDSRQAQVEEQAEGEQTEEGRHVRSRLMTMGVDYAIGAIDYTAPTAKTRLFHGRP